MPKVFYEYHITIDNGEDSWQWDLEQSRRVTNNINEYKNKKYFYVEIVKYKNIKDDMFAWDVDKDYFEVFPDNQTSDLPKYIQDNVNKVLQGVK